MEAIAVSGGIISAVGKLEEVERLRADNTTMVDLHGFTMLPGFIEPHTHPIASAIYWKDWIDISGFRYKSRESIMNCLRKKAKLTPPGEWIKGYGWDVVMIPDMHAPLRQELDAISNQHPIYLMTQTAHTAFCNSLALERANVDKTTVAPDGGQFMKDSFGELDGTAKEVGATTLIESAVPAMQKAVGTKFLKAQLDDYARNGYTTLVATGLFNMYHGAYQSIFDICSSPGSPVSLVYYHIDRVMQKRHKDKLPDTPSQSPLCHIGVKFWADGSPYSATMAVQEPYLETEMTLEKIRIPFCPCYGHLNYDFENLINRMRPYHLKGYQLAVHTQGERSIHQVLDIYQALLQEHPREDHRYRLEHCGLMTEEQMYRAKKLGVTVSFFPDHIHYWGTALRDDIIGQERSFRFMSMNTAKKVGIPWTVHSDSPCTPLGPFRVMQTCVTRCFRQGAVPETIGPAECVDVDDIIRAYTIEAARQVFHEDILGSLEVGKVADLLIVDKNPRKIDPEGLDKIQVIETYRRGCKVELGNDAKL